MNAVLPLQLFIYHPDNKSLVAYASDFHPFQWLGKNGDIAIRSHHSDLVMKFKLAQAFHDPKGQEKQWVFKPLQPMEKVSQVIVFNH